MSRKIFFIAVFMGYFTLSFSQTNWINYNEINLGLTSNEVTTIAMDNNSNIWIGASHGTCNGCGYGIDRFDGTNWTHFDNSNSGLPSLNIQKIVCDQNNNLWICYSQGSGLTKYDGTNWVTFDTLNSNIPSNFVTDLIVDDNNQLWLACNGITKLSGTNFINVLSIPVVLGYPFVINMITSDSNAVYGVGSGSGLYKYDVLSGITTNYDTANSNIPSMNYFAINRDNNGLIWLGYDGAVIGSSYGISVFDGNTFTSMNPFLSTYTWVGFGQTITADQSNNIWIANRCEGLYRYDGSQWIQMGLNLPQLGCSGFVYSDPSNNIWYGDVYSGVWTNTPTVGLAEQSIQQDINLLPNPFSDKLNITTETNEPLEITLFDITSRKVVHQSFTNSTSINTSHLSKGIYIYEVRNKNGVIKKGKVVKD